MPERDARFLTYLKAFFTDMLTGMSGPRSVPFAALALWVSSRSQKALWGCLAVMCAMFASYRVWRKERRDASAQLAEQESELTDLRDRLSSVTAAQQKPRALTLTIGAERNPPSQVLKVVANRLITVSRVEYMLSNETTIASHERITQAYNEFLSKAEAGDKDAQAWISQVTELSEELRFSVSITDSAECPTMAD